MRTAAHSPVLTTSAAGSTVRRNPLGAQTELCASIACGGGGGEGGD